MDSTGACKSAGGVAAAAAQGLRSITRLRAEPCGVRAIVLCTPSRKPMHAVVGKRGQQGTCSRVVINGLLCVALLCRMFSQCFTLLAAAAAPISSKQAVRCTPVAAMTVPQTAPSCHPQRMTAVRNGRCAPLMLLLRLCGILLLNRRRSRPWMTPVSMILSTPSVLARVPTR